MSGISSVLNIAKEALLTHQASVQVASHNIANVDTDGYTRQTLTLAPNQATYSTLGSIGNGVHGERIARQYDQFMTQRIMDQTSTQSDLQAQQSAMRMVETIFNEAPGMALNDMMSKFWESVQELADNPEVTATRQQIVQQAEIIFDQFQTMNTEIAQARYDIGVNLNSAVEDVNSLTKEIADLNNQITSSENQFRQANDLRDKRDQLVKELSGLLDINYFENPDNGAYSVLMNDGHSLVDGITNRPVGWENNELYILGTAKDGATTRTAIGDGSELGGKIGGWLEVRSQLLENDPENYLGRMDALANAMIREVNQIHSQGVGLTSFSDTITGTYMANNTGVLTSAIDITTAHKTIEAGAININGRDIGLIAGTAQINGLGMGKAYNTVQAINKAEAGVTASLTTLVAGDAVTGLAAGESVNFTVNGITVNYGPAAVAETADETAANIVNAINAAISTYNSDPANPIDMTIEAVVGDGTNGGVNNSIVLYNTVEGDESRIIIGDIETDPVSPDYPAESKLALTNGEFRADSTHNTGKLSLSSSSAITIESGNNDTYLDQLGLGSVMHTTQYATTAALPLGAGPSDFTFNLNDTNIVINLAGPLTEEEVATQIVATINTYQNATGVEAIIGNGLNGGEQNAIIFRNTMPGDTSEITLSNYSLIAGVDVVDPAEFDTTATGGGLLNDLQDDGDLIFDPAQHGYVSASLRGLDYFDELQLEGNDFGIWIYDSAGNTVLPQPVKIDLERANTMYDVVNAINSALQKENVDSFLSVDIYENRLRFNVDDAGHTFAFAKDNTNFLQAAGINTLLTGHNSSTFGVNELISDNLQYMAAGKVSDTGNIFRGDNSNALDMTTIQYNENVRFTGGSTSTLDDFYNSLISEIGTKGRRLDRDVEVSEIVMNQMNELRDATSGVSLDEEMANLIKFQHAYSAAAKLITTSDEMYQTLLTSVGIR